jgi:multidrug efflux pump subunit AcrB
LNAIVVVALKRPLTFVVLAILILLFGTLSIFRTPTDVFPDIKIPVVAIVWSYSGLSPEDMSGRIIYYYERALTTTVNDIEHIESQSLYGSGIVKVFLQPGTDVAAAQAQIAAISQTVLKQMPPGTTPPNILAYNASSVAVLSLQISSDTLPIADLFDTTSNFIRPQLVTVKGAAMPGPYGGIGRNVQVDLNQSALLAHGLSAQDVGAALARQNVVLPAGDQKIGAFDFMITTSSTPVDVETFNNMPIKQVGNAIVYLRDVAFVHRGPAPMANIVLVKGQKAILLQVLKSGNASTLDVVAGVKALLPGIEKTLPPGIHITVLNDASEFVKDSITDVVREMAIAAVLTGLMVLLFLGSWRSTVIIATSIPLAIMTSILMLSWFGQTINVMTLGGLALAVGILVDDATVMIENIAAHLEEGKELEAAIIDASNQIVIPTLVSTLCICIVWLPLFSLGGLTGFLFMPMAMAIVFAMLASFVLSRTLVPTMAAWMLKGEAAKHAAAYEFKRAGGHGHPPMDAHAGPFVRFQRGFEALFEKFRAIYIGALTGALARRGRFISIFLGLTILSMGLVPFLGQNFFPEIKSGEIDMHFRTQIGTRIEASSAMASLVNDEIGHLLPGQVKSVIDNCGLNSNGINQAYSASGTVGPADCDLIITLNNPESPVDLYRATLRRELPRQFPGTEFTFLPGDITAKILSFGLPAPIDVAIIGRNQFGNFAFAKKLQQKLAMIPGIADTHIQQAFGTPTLNVDMSRSYAQRTNLTAANIANNALATLSGSGQTAPTYWLDTTNGVSYLVNMQTPQDQLSTLNSLETIPIDSGNNDPTGNGMQLLGALGKISQTAMPLVVSHQSIIPAIDIYASTQVRDLGGVSADVERIVAESEAELPRGSHIEIRGQGVTMRSAYIQLVGGLLFSIVLVYLVIVVNFQSWLDPFIIITALPGALAGIAWSLFLTHTTLSVPALTGAIMCMGTATANSILVVSFARERLEVHGNAVRAAIEAGYGRVRPVLMTALAMIIGMLPMSLSNTQNAALGRAVMGGLGVATLATLLFVPTVFALLHGRTRKQVTHLPGLAGQAS